MPQWMGVPEAKELKEDPYTQLGLKSSRDNFEESKAPEVIP